MNKNKQKNNDREVKYIFETINEKSSSHFIYISSQKHETSFASTFYLSPTKQICECDHVTFDVCCTVVLSFFFIYNHCELDEI